MKSIYIKNIKTLDSAGKKEKDQSPVLQLLFILFLLQQALIGNGSVWSSAVSYLDEIVSLCLLAAFIWKSIQGFRFQKNERTILLLVTLILGIGLLSNILSHLQPLLYVLVDAFTCFKFLFAYLGIRALYSGKISECFIEKNFSWIAKTFAVVFFVLTIHDTFFTPLFPVSEYRYFTYSIKLFYSHPQFLASACIILMCVLVSTLAQRKSNLFFLFMLAFVIFRTFRMKSIGFVAVLFLLLILVYKFHIRSQLLLLLPLLFCGLIIGWEQIQIYFFNTETARMQLTIDSFRIASQYFPLGSGFATFGSNMANVHYSPLYRMLGYSGIYGMSENSTNYLSDTFWPILIAQFGYIGFLCFLGIIVKLFQIVAQFNRENLCGYIAMLSILLYMIISTTSESSFFNPFATFYFLFFALLVAQNGSDKKEIIPPKSLSRKYNSKYIK